MQPIDYTLDVKSPLQSILQGYQTGLAMKQVNQAQEAQKQMQSDLSNLFKTPGGPKSSDYAQLTLKYPQLNEQFKQSWDMMNEDQKTNRVNQASEVYAALSAGEIDVAKDILETQAQAAENAGDDRGAQSTRIIAQLIDKNPDVAKTSIALRLSSAMGPEKFTETFTKLEADRRSSELEESVVTEAQAKANKAAIDSKFAESQAVMDLQKKGWDITKIQEDIKVSKENSRIAALRADLARETNDLKRQQLEMKLADMERKRDEVMNTKVADIETARTNIDNMLNNIDRVIQTPLNVIGNATGPVDQWIPTIRQSTSDFQELVENVKAQSFLAQIPNIKGMGALSDAEGKKLEAALQNFSLRQSPERLLSNMKEAQRLMLKARENLATRYGVPNNIPDTPAVETSGDDIEALINQYAPGVD